MTNDEFRSNQRFTCYAPGHDWRADPFGGILAEGSFPWPYDDLEGYPAACDAAKRDAAAFLGHSDFQFILD